MNQGVKDEKVFEEAVNAFQDANAIIFNSMISNEDAKILQSLKEKYGIKLINKEAKKFQDFLNAFGLVSGKKLYSGDLSQVESYKGIILLGCPLSVDAVKLSSGLVKVSQKSDMAITYMHPLEDQMLNELNAQHIKYEVGSEEGVLAMLAETFVNAEGKQKFHAFFAELDPGYLCGESSVGEEEFETLADELAEEGEVLLVVGADLFNHAKAINIARILGMIDRYSDLKVVMLSSEVNTLGVSLICELDEMAEGQSIGVNVQGDYTLSSKTNADMTIPTLFEEVGTVTNASKQVTVIEATDAYNGYTIKDIANALGVCADSTCDFTAKLPAMSGYKAVAFDELKNSHALSDGVQGYELENKDVASEVVMVDDVDQIDEFNGTVVYRCNHPLIPVKTQDTDSDVLVLLGSKQFATAARIKSGAMVRFEMDHKVYQRRFEIAEDLKGTIAYNPVYDSTDNYDEYRYKRVNLEEINE